MAVVIVLLLMSLAHNSSSVLLSRYLGFKRVPVTGRSVLQRRPISQCVGLVPTPVGVLRQSSKARNSDRPDSWHLVKIRLTSFTAFSALPFD